MALDPLTGALLAVAAAWASVMLVILWPRPKQAKIRPAELRSVGGLVLATIGLQLLGVPVPEWLPIGVAVGGLAALLFVAWRRRG